MSSQPRTLKKFKYTVPTIKGKSKNKNNTNTEYSSAEEVDLKGLVEAARKTIGSKPIPYRHPKLNLDAPKMKLPPGIKGGKSRRHKRTLKRKHTMKRKH